MTFHNSIYGPVFGRGDIEVNDNGNIDNSCVNIGYAYGNIKYSFGDK